MLNRHRAVLALASIVLAACNASDPLAPPIDDGPCTLPSSLPPVTYVGTISPASMHDALIQAAGPMTAALGTGVDVQKLQSGINAILSAGAPSGDAACRLVSAAANALDALPDDPATRPDRAGIRIVLALSSRAFQASSFADIVADQ